MLSTLPVTVTWLSPLSWSLWTPVVRDHADILRSSHSRHLFLAVLQAGSPRPGCSTAEPCVLSALPKPADGCLPAVLSWGGQRGGKRTRVSSYQSTAPATRPCPGDPSAVSPWGPGSQHELGEAAIPCTARPPHRRPDSEDRLSGLSRVLAQPWWSCTPTTSPAQPRGSLTDRVQNWDVAQAGSFAYLLLTACFSRKCHQPIKPQAWNLQCNLARCPSPSGPRTGVSTQPTWKSISGLPVSTLVLSDASF